MVRRRSSADGGNGSNRRKSSTDMTGHRKADRKMSEIMEGVAMPPSMSFLETQRITAMQMEIYGFAGWIASIAIFVCYLLWAYVPDAILASYGITYYPSRYWALAVPAMLVMTLMALVVFYIAINWISTAPLDSYNTIRGTSEFGNDSCIGGDRSIHGHIDQGRARHPAQRQYPCHRRYSAHFCQSHVVSLSGMIL
ncbi:hypothetical protein H257_13823 [Aphanomyces astaci]|uniref:PIG-P domain-containing protein n=1 Tax=Aphanomyces astaci TaxID=112090 RepID=W4FT93_APHAT|nr:hypothetical protein H257_13823 [Aphanomyces astaci]ETV70730.1 hypothetical protein H257_13823 [Aphanomyces astaci]|eukprot:XP_009839795.1 hypothetical protein H257_13823 [Aphanomyces astaci]